MTTLSKAYVVAPAAPAVTVTDFSVVDVQENYGYQPANVDLDAPGMRENYGRGQKNSVQAVISLPTTPPTLRTIMVWKDAEYLAVRGIWTDDTMNAAIKAILEAE